MSNSQSKPPSSKITTNNDLPVSIISNKWLSWGFYINITPTGSSPVEWFRWPGSCLIQLTRGISIRGIQNRIICNIWYVHSLCNIGHALVFHGASYVRRSWCIGFYAKIRLCWTDRQAFIPYRRLQLLMLRNKTAESKSCKSEYFFLRWKIFC